MLPRMNCTNFPTVVDEYGHSVGYENDGAHGKCVVCQLYGLQ